MTPADAEKFAELWKRQKLAFDTFGKKGSPERMEMFFEDLKAYPIDHVERAFEWHRKNGKSFPKPKDIQEALIATARRDTFDADEPAFDPENPFHCTDCHDDGYRELWCPGDKENPQWDDKPWRGRQTEHCGARHLPVVMHGQAVWRGHEYMRRCPCYLTNKNLRRKRFEA